MKNPHSVLREKEQDLERVRKEVQALLMVISLLADDQPAPDMHAVPSAFYLTPVRPPDNDMAQLELYYPFVGHLLMPEPAKRIGSETPQWPAPKTGR